MRVKQHKGGFLFIPEGNPSPFVQLPALLYLRKLSLIFILGDGIGTIGSQALGHMLVRCVRFTPEDVCAECG